MCETEGALVEAELLVCEAKTDGQPKINPLTEREYSERPSSDGAASAESPMPTLSSLHALRVLPDLGEAPEAACLGSQEPGSFRSKLLSPA